MHGYLSGTLMNRIGVSLDNNLLADWRWTVNKDVLTAEVCMRHPVRCPRISSLITILWTLSTNEQTEKDFAS